eukprot:COSAG01_NODE_6554_length_3611_cov_1.222665_4_plen_69_part_00
MVARVVMIPYSAVSCSRLVLLCDITYTYGGNISTTDATSSLNHLSLVCAYICFSPSVASTACVQSWLR